MNNRIKGEKARDTTWSEFVQLKLSGLKKELLSRDLEKKYGIDVEMKRPDLWEKDEAAAEELRNFEESIEALEKRAEKLKWPNYHSAGT